MKIKLLLFFFFAISVSACKSPEYTDTVRNSSAVAPQKPSKKLNVGLLIVDGVYNSELIAPMDIFHHTIFHDSLGMRVFTVAPDSAVVTSFEGLNIIPDYGFSDPTLPEIDILVVPSAEFSMTTDLKNEALLHFVREKSKSAQYVVSLCDGAFVLAEAGILNGHHSTTFPGDIQRYKRQFPELEVIEGVSFVHDGKLITSAGGAKSYDPALYLCELLYGKQVAIGLAKGLVIDWDLDKIKHANYQ